MLKVEGNKGELHFRNFLWVTAGAITQQVIVDQFF